jgi:hypothetical protein
MKIKGLKVCLTTNEEKKIQKILEPDLRIVDG